MNSSHVDSGFQESEHAFFWRDVNFTLFLVMITKYLGGISRDALKPVFSQRQLGNIRARASVHTGYG